MCIWLSGLVLPATAETQKTYLTVSLISYWTFLSFPRWVHAHFHSNLNLADCLFLIIYTNGSLFKGTLLLHGNIYLPFLSLTLRSRERYVVTTRQFNHFSLSLSPPIYPVGPSQLKKQNHISKPLLHHLVSETPAGNTHFTYPKWGVLKETDRLQVPNLLPSFHSIRFLKPCLGGWLSHCQEAEARNGGRAGRRH